MMKIIRIPLYFVIVIFVMVLMITLGCSQHTETSKPSSSVTARIVDYGIYKVINPGTDYIHPESTAGYASLGVKVSLVNRTTSIPLQKGIVFGFEFEIKGFSHNAPTAIVYRVKHPAIKKPDGNITTGYDELFPSMPDDNKLKTAIYYQLSEDWELVPGEWSIAVVYEGTILLEKVFQVSD